MPHIYFVTRHASGPAYDQAVVVLVVLLALTVVGVGFAVLRSTVWDLVWSALLVVAAAVWIAVDAPVEGQTLIVFSAGHGLTTGDLLGLPAVALALALTSRRLTLRRAPRGAHSRSNL